MARKQTQRHVTRRGKPEWRWAKWKRAQRKHPSKSGKIRHHSGSGSKVTILSRKGHAQIHKRSGTAGGRPRKRGKPKK